MRDELCDRAHGLVREPYSASCRGRDTAHGDLIKCNIVRHPGLYTANVSQFLDFLKIG